MDALGLPRAMLVGYDWGGRAACVVAALWPERVRGLVVANGYSIQNIAASVTPAPPEQEQSAWYQYYFHTERGRAGLQANRRELCKLLWRLWSPNWDFDDATYERTAPSFDNPDFVDIVIHSYRHRFGYAPGDPAFEAIERRLAAQPPISAPTIVLQGEGDGVNPAGAGRRHGAARVFHRALSAAIDPSHRPRCSAGSPQAHGRRGARTPRLKGPCRHPRRNGIVPLSSGGDRGENEGGTCVQIRLACRRCRP